MPQNVKAKVASPTRLKTANVRVSALPQSKTNSLIRRPIVPMMSKIKPLSLATSPKDMSAKFLFADSLTSSHHCRYDSIRLYLIIK